MADLIIVDVSNQNPNVFYEFGMAVALGKLILPICYSESYYRRVVPQEIKVNKKTYEKFEHHIGCYPWRKALHEYYGIRYIRGCKSPVEEKGTRTHYMEYEKVTDIEYGFSDKQYARFPYHDLMQGDEYKNDKEEQKKIGEVIYEKLMRGYNEATCEDNTLVVYTMDGFLNESHAGKCIVNFYHDITSRMKQEECFCGERVGVLVQGTVVPEGDKDSKNKQNLSYGVGEIIHIGVNQATYLSMKKRIKIKGVSKNYQIFDINRAEIRPKQRKSIRRFVKGYVGNRGILVYPNNPVYVNRIKNKFQENIFEDLKQKEDETCNCSRQNAFCLYHVMLRTLRCTNEIVVDISNNCIQSLFWLGAAHGQGVYAITVLYEQTDKEKELMNEIDIRKSRTIFDIAGLWTAIYRSDDTEGFYEQLASVQKGIEYASKLMTKTHGKSEKNKNIALESYYRNRFWNTLLKYNQLKIYLPMSDAKDEKENLKVYTSKWDFDAISALSQYLSKRTIIGQYAVESLRESDEKEETLKENFICVADKTSPLKEELPDYIYSKIKRKNIEQQEYYNIIHKKVEGELERNGDCKCVYKGFQEMDKPEAGLFTMHATTKCAGCNVEINPNSSEMVSKIYHTIEEIENSVCEMKGKDEHEELAQLILWRESPENIHDRNLFRVAIIGSSGPATYGLTSLFIDERQKETHFGKGKAKQQKESKKESQETLLCELQRIVREKFLEVLKSRLKEKLSIEDLENNNEEICDEKQGRCYYNLVYFAIVTYLNTVLYRYFLPFLSEKDIKRLYNGMYTFIHTMKAENVSPFSLKYSNDGDPDYDTTISEKSINDVIEKVLKVFLNTLEDFKGIEVFYRITVRHHLDKGSKPEIDDRSASGIKMLEEPEKSINCFFVSKSRVLDEQEENI